MKYLLIILVSLGSLLSSATAEVSNTTLLIGATVIDGTGAEPRPNTAVLIEGAHIKAIGPLNTINIPAGTKRIDITGKYLLPGFIDLHFHVMYPPNSDPQSDSLATVRAMHFMGMALKSGVTAVRDTGATIEPMQALLKGQELGYFKSLRLYPVGQLITTIGGHATSWSHFATGPYGFRDAVRKMYAAGFRYIKLSPMYTQEEITAAIDEAKKLGMRVTTHGGGGSDTVPPA